jgi:hypothetical protein
MSLKIGDLIIDNRDREGIVVSECEPPDAAWLKQQRDRRVLALGICKWWKVLPSTGGAVRVPEPLAKYLRPATLEDAQRYVQEWSQSYHSLVRLFPKLIELTTSPKLH